MRCLSLESEIEENVNVWQFGRETERESDRSYFETGRKQA